MAKELADQLQEFINEGRVTVDEQGVVRMKNYTPRESKPTKNGKKFNKGVDPFAKRFPEHYVKVGLLLHHNRELTRLASLAIIKILKERGDIAGDSCFVHFKYDKITVRYDSLIREYSYSEEFIITSLLATLEVFKENAEHTINNLTRKLFSKAAKDVCDADNYANAYNYLKEHSEECRKREAEEGITYREE